MNIFHSTSLLLYNQHRTQRKKKSSISKTIGTKHNQTKKENYGKYEKYILLKCIIYSVLYLYLYTHTHTLSEPPPRRLAYKRGRHAQNISFN